MSLLYQNDPRLSELIAGNGCELLCTIAIPSLHVNRFLSPREVSKLTEYCIEQRMIGPRLSISHATSARAVMHETFRSLGIVDMRGDQVGSLIHGNVSWWGWYGETCFDYAIHRGRLLNDAPHSVLLDMSLREIYNPYPSKHIVQDGAIFLYRVKRTDDWKIAYE